MNKIDFSTLDAIVRASMSEKRYIHTLGVVKASEWLAGIFLPDRIDEIRCASYLHDIAKELDGERTAELLPLLDSLDGRYRLTDEDRATSSALHSFLGAVLIKERLSEYYTPDIFSAVFFHTLGSHDMSLFERIVYLSDFIEENRSYSSCRETRDFLLSSLNRDMMLEEKIQALNKAVYLTCKFTVESLEKKGLAINSRTLLTKSAFSSLN